MNSVVMRAADESDWTEIEDLLTQNALPLAGAHEHLRSYWGADAVRRRADLAAAPDGTPTR